MKQQNLPKVVKQVENDVVSKLVSHRDTVFQRFPLLFTMLGTFGVVATLYGFEGIINRVHLLADNPIIVLGVGVAILLVTGTLYKKL